MVKALFCLMLCSSALFMSSCTHSILDTKDVRCPFVERGGCQSMEQVNRMITAHRYTPDGKYVQQEEECVGGGCFK